MRAGDDERKVNYEWPYDTKILNSYYPGLQHKNTKSAIKNILKNLFSELKGFKFVITLV